MALPILQLMLGIGIGILGYFLLMPALEAAPQVNREPTRYSDESEDQRRRRRRHQRPGDTCVICLNEMLQSNMHTLDCGHALHTECYTKCMKTTQHCPLCRQKM